jgi:hypothetical protein
MQFVNICHLQWIKQVLGIHPDDAELLEEEKNFT